MPRSVASDQGLHFLSMSHNKDTRYILVWVKFFMENWRYFRLHIKTYKRDLRVRGVRGLSADCDCGTS